MARGEMCLRNLLWRRLSRPVADKISRCRRPIDISRARKTRCRGVTFAASPGILWLVASGVAAWAGEGVARARLMYVAIQCKLLCAARLSSKRLNDRITSVSQAVF